MRNLLEIVTFHNPFTSVEESELKERRVISMIEDYIRNSGEAFVGNQETTESYIIHSYTHSLAIINLSIKLDEKMQDYFLPHIIIQVDMDDFSMEKSLVEDFLNIITRFFSGASMGEYFLEYDTVYKLDHMNEWKKYTVNDIKNIDMREVQGTKNKLLLDSLCYLHYTLEKQIRAIGIGSAELVDFLNKKTVSWYLENELTLTEHRINITERELLINLTTLHQQIQIILSYFLSHS